MSILVVIILPGLLSITALAADEIWFPTSDGVLEFSIQSFEEGDYPSYDLRLASRLDESQRSEKVYILSYPLYSVVDDYIKANGLNADRKIDIGDDIAISAAKKVFDTYYKIEFILKVDGKSYALASTIDISVLYPDVFYNRNISIVKRCLETLKDNLKKPESLNVAECIAWDSMLFNDNGRRYYLIRYGAENGFGGTTQSCCCIFYDTEQQKYAIIISDDLTDGTLIYDDTGDVDMKWPSVALIEFNHEYEYASEHKNGDKTVELSVEDFK